MFKFDNEDIETIVIVNFESISTERMINQRIKKNYFINIILQITLKATIQLKLYSNDR